VKYLPTPYSVEDANRMTLGYFCLSSLALLPSPAVDETTTDSALETMLRPVQRQGFIDWVYQQQSTSTGGFRGSDSIIDDKEELNRPNLIQSYTALLILALLRDDLIKLDRFKLLNFLQKCQQLDGSFTNSYCTDSEGEEEPGDPRTSYAAFSICSLLNDWNFIDVDKGLKFLNSCRNQQGGGGGGFGQRPFSEANAGPTYCAIACYKLCGRIKQIENKKSLLRWLINLQQQQPIPTSSSASSSSSSGSTPCSSIESRSDDDHDDDDDESASVMDHECAGFQGRVNKPLDACYSFWSLGALKVSLPSHQRLKLSLFSHFLSDSLFSIPAASLIYRRRRRRRIGRRYIIPFNSEYKTLFKLVIELSTFTFWWN